MNRLSFSRLLSHPFWGHLAFWVLYLITNTFSQGYYSGNYFQQFLYFLHYMPAIMALTYFTTHFLIPRFLYTKRYKLFFFLTILSAILTSFIQRLNIIYIVIPSYSQNPDFEFPLFSYDIFVRISLFYPYVIFASAITILAKWYKSEKTDQQLREEKLQTELKFLKAQINPHFLFNTLNSLYVLAKKNEPRTPEIVLKLANLLRFIVYECNYDKIPLTKEIKIIEDYIDLEKLRFGDELEIDFTVVGNTENVKITPVLLLPLVENAFKHGVSKSVSTKKIKIELINDDTSLKFHIVNSKDTDIGNEKEINLLDVEGVGVQNIQKRLALLYKNEHFFSLEDKGNSFEAKLIIEHKRQDHEI